MTPDRAAHLVRVGGVCALVGVSAGLAGAVVGAIHGLGGQQLPVQDRAGLLLLETAQGAYRAREWLFLLYAVFAVGEGVGLFYLTRPAGSIAIWALVAWSVGIAIAIAQDAASVAFVERFPIEYASADDATRRALEPLARAEAATIGVQQSVANTLLGIGTALYSIAILRARVAGRAFALLGLIAAAAGVFYAVVTSANLENLQAAAESAFGVVVLWDLCAAIVMIPIRDRPADSYVAR